MVKRRSVTLSGGLLFILSFGYLLAELFFNVSLLDVAGDIKSSPEKIENIQLSGRAISAFGLFLLVAGFIDLRRFGTLKSRARLAMLSCMGVLSLFLLLAPFFNPNLRYGTADSIVGFGAFLVMLVILADRNRHAFVNLAGLCMLLWSAGFLGQKILIEQLLVDRTDWQSRVNARYVLMLRAGFEGCTIFLQDMNLCNAGPENESAVKSARIITSALWTLYPMGIYQDVLRSRDTLIARIALQESADSLNRDYQVYLAEVEKQIARFDDEIAKYQKEVVEKYYTPYARASMAYFIATVPEALQVEAEKAADQIDEGIERGWQRYQYVQAAYQERRQSFSVKDLMNRTQKRVAAYFEKSASDYCTDNGCPRVQAGSLAQNVRVSGITAIAAEMSNESEPEYPLDLKNRGEFERQSATQSAIREAVENKIRSVSAHKDFVLPYGWRYSRYNFIEMFKDIYREEAITEWNARTGGKLPPGLSRDAFFAAVGIEPLPQIPVESFNVMSKDEFFHDIILSYYKESAVNIFDSIEAEKHLYGENRSMAEKGRNYVRAVYIPAIALVVSLFVVSITLLRGWIACVEWSLKRMRTRVPRSAFRGLRAGAIAASVLMFVLVPYSQPNTYAGGKLYRQYLHGAAAQYPVMAYTLDWALHVQPLVYKAGNTLF